MLKVLGTKKMTFIVMLLLVSAGIGAGWYYWLLPERELVTQQLQTTQGEVETRRQEVAKMKEEFVLLQSQLKAFKSLEGQGFFNEQDRSAAIEKLEKLSNYAGLLRAKLEFDKGELVIDPLADAAGYAVLRTPVKIITSSIDDVDVYSFVKFIEEKFPGKTDISLVKLNRSEMFNEAILRKIGSGDVFPLIGAEINFDWYTMANKNVVTPAEGGN